MLFSVNYKSVHKEQADEIRCPSNQLGSILDFIKTHPEKRYLVDIVDSIPLEKSDEQIKLLHALVDENYTVRCGSVQMLRDIRQEGFNAFLRFPISDWESVFQLFNMGVSDIYIDGQLGFQANAWETLGTDMNVRVSPTISPNGSLTNTIRTARSFFIRPEDLNAYSTFVDIIDFNVKDQNAEDALFQIYKRGSFNYPIDQLIEGLASRANNTLIPEDFAKHRLNCEQRCYVPGVRCALCARELIFAEKTMDYFTAPSN